MSTTASPPPASANRLIGPGDIDELLLHRLDQLLVAGWSNDAIELIDAAGILSQLLLDQEPLTDAANRHHGKLPLRYTVAGERLQPSGGVQLVLDTIDPNPPEGIPVAGEAAILKGTEFISYPIASIDNELVTVRDLIDYVRNIMGGVHLGRIPPRVAHVHELFQRVVGFREASGVMFPLPAIRPLCRIVVASLAPLAEAIEQKHRGLGLPMAQNLEEEHRFRLRMQGGEWYEADWMSFRRARDSVSIRVADGGSYELEWERRPKPSLERRSAE